ncbi:MAG: PKD domain-containing protein, partial [Bacteroidia bacterium]
SMPAVDTSMTDGNCRLIIPAGSCGLIEKNTLLPSTGSSTYPTTFTPCGNWATVGLSNTGGDSFQIRDASGTLISAVSYNNNTVANMVYVTPMLTGKVGNNLNLIDNNPYNSANWATATVAGNETPGAPNNAANAAWISSMNFSCGSVIPTALTATVTATNAGCTCNGSATVTASGAVAPYTYSWSPSGGTGTTVSGLCAGNFSVTVTSANGCVQTVTVNILAINLLTATVTSTDVSCHGSTDGSATVTTSNAALPITYTWSPSGGNNAIASDLSIGNYSVTLTDANTCTATATIIINQPTTVSVSIASTNVSCNGGSTGAATLTTSGGTGPYTYTWSPSGGNNATATNLAQGTYSIHILDAHLCIKDTQVVITEPPPITATLTSSASSCGLANGSTTATAIGGTGTLNYIWTPTGGNASTASNLPAGLYTVTITDALACSLSDTIRVQQFLSPVLSVSTTSVLCNGGNSGTATSTITSGGTPAYTYTWSPSGGNNASATGLTQGSYTLFVTDAKGCKDTAYATITQPTVITATLTSTPATCGNNNGTTTSIINGGVGAYTYTWIPSGGNSSAANSLASGSYTLTINDGNLCTYSASINVGIKLSPVLSITSTSVACFGATTGSASVTINAGTGTAPFTYSWSPISGSNSTINNLPIGSYTVLVTDSAGCMATATVSIIQPTALTITPTSTLATCGMANGIATCTVSGGTPGYTYTWSPNGGNNQTTTNNLVGNSTYTVTVKDANNCINAASIYINKTPALTLTISSTQSVTCNGSNNGSVTVASSGSASTIYNWMPSGGSTLTANNLSGTVAGTTYTLVGNDGGCRDSVTATIIQPPTFSITVNNPTVCIGQTTTLTASGANTYTWSTGATTPTTTVNPVSTTVYTVNANNSNGCPAVQNTATVIASPALTISVTPTNTTICQGKSTTLTATSSGGGGGTNQYTWSPVSSSSSSVSVSPTTTLTIYTVSVYNAACAATASTTAQVNVYSNPVMSFSATPTSGCAPVCANFTASPGLTSYIWNFGDGNSGASSNTIHCYALSGNYDVSVSAITSNSCVVTTTQANFVNVFANPKADFIASSFTTTVTEGTVNFTDESSTTITNWNWMIDTVASIIQNPTHIFSTEGTYSVTLIVTNTNGCMDTITKEIIIEPDFVFYAPNCLTPNGDGRNELFLPVGTGWDNNNFNLWIYDRWGSIVLHTTNPTQGWDGKKQNEKVQEDTYIWRVSLYDINGMPHEFHGQVTVIR